MSISKIPLAALQEDALLPSGIVMYFANSTAPNGWIKANGAAISRTAYSSLFTAIGTTYGAGDGSTTFNLPDLRGEFVRGFDDGRGVDSGRAFGTNQSGQIGSHDHAMLATSLSASVDDRFGGSGATYGVGQGTAFEDYRVASNGGNETRSRNVALLACIKY